MIITKFVPLDPAIDGYTARDCDGNFVVYVNEALSPREQSAVIEREQRGCRDDDFNPEKTNTLI
jgi:hypothetical protein